MNNGKQQITYVFIQSINNLWIEIQIFIDQIMASNIQLFIGETEVKASFPIEFQLKFY